MLGSWVLEQACKAWQALSAQSLAPPRLAVNVAAAELEQRDYATTTLHLLAEYAMPTSALQLEVAEEVLDAAPSNGPLLQNLTTLRHHGVHVALDQFGRRQAALGQLSRWPVNVVKLDARCIRDLRSQPAERALLAGIAGYTRALKQELIFCGIESAADLENLRWLTPTLAQGYGLAAPSAQIQPQRQQVTC
jgi:EAL domain-containing protein (putative c-di-GMP-specific phosphodiesterase class I)